MKTIRIIPLLAVLGGCAIAQADMANKTRESLVGTTKQDVLSCMGAPAHSVKVENTEVWKYNSGGSVVGSGSTFGSAHGITSYGTSSIWGSGSSHYAAETRYCEINIVMSNNVVARVNFSGRTGGLLTNGSECYHAISNCTKPKDKAF